MNVDNTSDEELYRLFLQDRDDQVFAELVRRHQRMALGLAYGYCGKMGLAEEIVQEAFLKIAREPSPDCLKSFPSFAVWFSGVTLNMARFITRTERRNVIRASNPRYKARQKDVDADRSKSNVPDSPDKEWVPALGSAIDQLSEEIRLPLLLQYMQGMTQEQIGAITGVSQAMVSRRIQKGISILKSKLAQSGIAISAVAMPGLLNQLEYSVPSAEFSPEVIRDLALRAKEQKVEILSSTSWKPLKLALYAASLLVLAGLGYYISRPTTVESATVLSVKTATSPAPAAQPAPASPVYTWEFNRPDVQSVFKLLVGTWYWQAGDGKIKPGMIAENILVTLPLVAEQRPHHVQVLLTPIKNGQRVEYSIDYVKDQQQTVPHKERWLIVNSYNWTPNCVLEFASANGWVIARMQHEPCYVIRYLTPPTPQIGLTFKNCIVHKIEFRYLAPEEVSADLADPTALIAKYKLEHVGKKK